MLTFGFNCSPFLFPLPPKCLKQTVCRFRVIKQLKKLNTTDLFIHTSHRQTEFTIPPFLFSFPNHFLSFSSSRISHYTSSFILVFLCQPLSLISCLIPFVLLLCRLSVSQANCASLQASLVSVHSPESFLYQQTTINGFSPTWLGGFYLDVSRLNTIRSSVYC